MATTSFHTKYRPESLDQVIGQDAVVKSITALLNAEDGERGGASHAFYLCGPSGVGKTTLARIIGKMVGCQPTDITEVDAASHSGVESMRDLTGSLIYRNLSGRPRMIIVDEAHALSKSAWQSLLKVLEEPPAGVYWCICTTEANKIPATIETRCSCYTLKEVPVDDLYDLLVDVCRKEGLKITEDVLALIAEQSLGSPRRALSNLSLCLACKTRKQAAELLKTGSEDGTVLDLCRAIASGKLRTWSDAAKVLAPLRELNAESIRMTVVGYFSSVALGAKTNKAAAHALSVLDAFREPYPAQGFHCLLLSVGELLLGE